MGLLIVRGLVLVAPLKLDRFPMKAGRVSVHFSFDAMSLGGTRVGSVRRRLLRPPLTFKRISFAGLRPLL